METINKVKRQTSEWQKISVNKATDERLIPQICQKLMQLDENKTKQKTQKPNQKIKGSPKWTFLQKEQRWPISS